MMFTRGTNAAMRLAAVVVAALTLAVLHGPCLAATVQPQLGGGTAGLSEAPMKHADVSLVGTSLVVHVDATVPTPLLRPLDEADQFDPNMPWAVLDGTAHNFQYGWNPGGILVPPTGAAIWVELLDATPGLATYESLFPWSGTFDPIFGNAGSSARWKWSRQMTHNAYAVTDPVLPQYDATYRVYVGDDDAVGEPWPEYTPAEVTLTWLADIASADFDGSGAVDGGDFLAWQREFSTGARDAGDLQLWQAQFGATAGVNAVAIVPEPAAGWLACAGAAVAVVASIRCRAWSL